MYIVFNRSIIEKVNSFYKRFQKKRWELRELYSQQQPEKVNKAFIRWIHRLILTHILITRDHWLCHIKVNTFALTANMPWLQGVNSVWQSVQLEFLVLCQSSFSMKWKLRLNILSILLSSSLTTQTSSWPTPNIQSSHTEAQTRGSIRNLILYITQNNHQSELNVTKWEQLCTPSDRECTEAE